MSACATPDAYAGARPPARPLQVNRAVFEASKGRLKVVGRAGVGVDNVDLAAATEVRRRAAGPPSHPRAAPGPPGAALPLCARKSAR